MKTLLITIFTTLLSFASIAQTSCSPRVILNCDSTLTVIDDVELLPNGAYPGVAYIEFTAGQGLTPPTSTWITTPAQGVDLTYPTTTSISPSSGHYAVTVYYYPSQTNVLTNSKICTSTTIMNSAWDPITNGYIGVPALLGYQYQNGVPAIQVATCVSQTAARFVKVKKGRKR
jgi:hypothetical protein